jgi:hypothetical protein
MFTPNIPYESIIEDFRNHIEQNDNKRILFSGPFGSGKSTFLENFFKDSDQYLPIKISPIDYSVSANQDIFEFIKIDIISELLNLHKDFIDSEKELFPILLVLQTFVKDELKILSLLKSIIPSFKVVNSIDKVYKDFVKYKNRINTNNKEKISRFLSLQKNSKGSPREMDEISLIIVKILEDITKSKYIKTILVIDDLDRLDPDHIFRIINILSSHWKNDSDENKFGFDKVILVCDVINIKYIFEHKFGPRTDFSGYINKYYSHKIFSFDFHNIISKKLRDLIQYNFDNLLKEEVEISKLQLPYQYIISETPGSFYQILSTILKDLIDSKLINIRNIIKAHKFNFRLYHFNLPNNGGIVLNKDYPLILIIDVLKTFFYSDDDLLNALYILKTTFKADYRFLPRRKKTNPNHTYLITLCVPFFIIYYDLGLSHFEKLDFSEDIENEFKEKITIQNLHLDDSSESYHHIFSAHIKPMLVEDNRGIFEEEICFRPNPYHFIYLAAKAHFEENNDPIPLNNNRAR